VRRAARMFRRVSAASPGTGRRARRKQAACQRADAVPPHGLAAGMIAGGTGITPMYQVAQTVLRDTGDRTSFSLIFANVNADDILIKGELDALAAAYPGRFKVRPCLRFRPSLFKLPEQR
jgi:ferredoxin-NADP reductase